MKGKKELAKAVAEQVKINRNTATEAVDKVFETIKNALAQGETVTVKGFGTFKAVEKAGRATRNPRTGEQIIIAAHKAVKFKPSPDFKDSVK